MRQESDNHQSRNETRLVRLVWEGEISPTDGNRIAELVAAYDDHNPEFPLPDGREMYDDNRKQSYMSDRTLGAWIQRLTTVAQNVELTDPETTEADLNRYFTTLRRDGASTNTLKSLQSTTCKFYRYHGDLGIDPYRIDKDESEGNGSNYDPDEMLDRPEIDAFHKAASTFREDAIFSALIYTGLRNGGLRSLRIGDIDLESGTYKFNTETNDDGEGLKNIHEPRDTRPLLQAEGPIRDWINKHPDGDDPEAYLVTAPPWHSDYDPYSMVTGPTVRRVMKKLGEKAAEILDREEIGKPHNPHAMRHNYVTICVEDYGLDAPEVKHLIGHAPWSDVMQTTYQHLSTDNINDKAREGAGLIEPEESTEKRLSPETCLNCKNPLREGAKFCDSCGIGIDPGARESKEAIEDTTHQGAKEADSDPEKDEIDQLRDLLKENPEIVDKLIDSDGSD